MKKTNRPEETFIDLLAAQLLADLGFEKASEIADKVREQHRKESGNNQYSAVSTRFMVRLAQLKDQKVMMDNHVLQQDQHKKQE